jgi:hypothetical protein
MVLHNTASFGTYPFFVHSMRGSRDVTSQNPPRTCILPMYRGITIYITILPIKSYPCKGERHSKKVVLLIFVCFRDFLDSYIIYWCTHVSYSSIAEIKVFFSTFQCCATIRPSTR